MKNKNEKIKKRNIREIFFTLHLIGVLIAAFSLIAKMLFAQQETSVILWILSIILIIPYLFYKQLKQENWTSNDLWPYAFLAVVCIIYLLITNNR